MTQKNPGAAELASVEVQMGRVRLGLVEQIECPYCGGVNREGVDWCCQTFSEAAAAILHRWGFNEVRDRMYRIQDMAARN